MSDHAQSSIKPAVLQHYPCIHSQVVAWGDMDAFQHLNNVVYYRYAESARIAYLEQLGVFGAENILVLAQSSCHYLLPVTYPDTLLVGVRTKSIGNSSMVTEYCYYSTAQQAVVATAESVLVRLDKMAQKKVCWTETEHDKVLSFEATAGHTPQSSR